MGRLYEASAIDQTYEIAERFMSVIIRDCGPYLREIRGNNPKFLLSGRKSDYSWFEKDIRVDRRPKDLNIEIHNDIDELFRLKFGYPARSNSIFTTTNVVPTTHYGKTYLIFPKGPFKFLWSPKIRDLVDYMSSDLFHNFIMVDTHNGIYDVFYDEFNNGATDKETVKKMARERYIEALQGVVDVYSKTNFRAALDSGNEIMITCKSYYAVEHIRWYIMFKRFIKYMSYNMPTIEIFKEWFYTVNSKDI